MDSSSRQNGITRQWQLDGVRQFGEGELDNACVVHCAYNIEFNALQLPINVLD